jgi:hypothetical protein
MIYLHIDLKASFIIHANYQSGKKKKMYQYQAPTGYTDLSLEWCLGVNLS